MAAKEDPTNAQLVKYSTLDQATRDAMDAATVASGGTPPTFQQLMDARDAEDAIYYTDRDGELTYGARPEETFQDPFQGDIIEGNSPYPEYEFEWVDDTNRENVRGEDGRVQQPMDPLPPTYPRETTPLRQRDPFETPDARDGTWNFTPGEQQQVATGYEHYDAGNRPGEQSPWGTPEGGPGGNAEFYQRQLGNLLNQQDAYQTAATNARAAAAQPQEAPPAFSWDDVANYQGPQAWYDREGVTGPSGNDTVPLGDGSYGYNPGYDFEKGMSNSDILSQLNNIFDSEESQNFWKGEANNNPNFNDSRYWASFDDPNDFMQTIRTNNPTRGAEFMDNYQKLANNIWTPAAPTEGAPS